MSVPGEPSPTSDVTLLGNSPEHHEVFGASLVVVSAVSTGKPSTNSVYH